MQTWQKILLIGFAAFIPIGAVIVYGVYVSKQGEATAESGPKDYKAVDWKMLRGLNLETGEKSLALVELTQERVKIPGFVVPLEDDITGFSEFLLVPSPQACIHVPPPPANQMVFVQMTGGRAPKRSDGPVWLMGRLTINDQTHQFGKASYKFYAEDSEPYRVNY